MFIGYCMIGRVNCPLLVATNASEPPRVRVFTKVFIVLKVSKMCSSLSLVESRGTKLHPGPASRRQDVVLDARDVDVAVRAVALHGTCGLWLILTLSGAALER